MIEREAILEVKDLHKYFAVPKKLFQEAKYVKAVNDVSFTLYKNETLGIVGESGCGKSTTGRCLTNLIPITSGTISYCGKDISKMKRKERKAHTKEVQMIFQDPYSSLNPRMTVGKIIEEPLVIHKIGGNKEERMQRVLDMMDKVGLRRDMYYRYPHEFSGGQRQRIGLASALILEPKIIICDEPVSALDVSIQSQVLNLLNSIKKNMDMTYVFISHNMSVVRYVCDRVAVMYLGRIVEIADTDELYNNPIHPYTKALLSAVPEADPHVKKDRIILKGEIPSPLNPPDGCVFHNRCLEMMENCTDKCPRLREVAPGHFVSCLKYARKV